MNKKILMSIMSIVFAGSLAIAGTYAWFSDTEASTNNSLSAGTLNLVVNGGDLTGEGFIDVSDVAPGYSESTEFTLENTGTIEGTATVSIENLEDLDDINSEPEEDDDPQGSSITATTTGELSENMDIVITDITEGSPGTEVYNGTVAALNGWDADLGTLAGGETKTFQVDVSIDSTVDNSIQGDKVTGDIEFKLDQVQP